MKLLSSLAKVFQDENPVYQPECLKLSALWGETVSFQAAYTGDFFMRERLDVRVVSPIESQVRVRTVEQVPVGRATNRIVDDNYLKTTSGLYPDLLRELKDGKALVCSNQWRSLWIDVDVTDEIKAGDYEIEIQLVIIRQTVRMHPLRMHDRKLRQCYTDHRKLHHRRAYRRALLHQLDLDLIIPGLNLIV